MMIRKVHKKTTEIKPTLVWRGVCVCVWEGGGRGGRGYTFHWLYVYGDIHIYILREYTYHVTLARLAERAWCTKFQSSLLNVYFRLSGVQASFLLIYFRNGPQ